MTRPAYLGLGHQGFSAGDPSAPSYAPPNVSLTGGVTPAQQVVRVVPHALLAFRNAGEPEDAGTARAVAHQAPVARLEHVERDLRSGQ